MDTEDARVTREEAARLAGVSPRTINRWSAKGLISVKRYPAKTHRPATYLKLEILRAMGVPAEKEAPENVS